MPYIHRPSEADITSGTPSSGMNLKRNCAWQLTWLCCSSKDLDPHCANFVCEASIARRCVCSCTRGKFMQPSAPGHVTERSAATQCDAAVASRILINHYAACRKHPARMNDFVYFPFSLAALAFFSHPSIAATPDATAASASPSVPARACMRLGFLLVVSSAPLRERRVGALASTF